LAAKKKRGPKEECATGLAGLGRFVSSVRAPSPANLAPGFHALLHGSSMQPYCTVQPHSYLGRWLVYVPGSSHASASCRRVFVAYSTARHYLDYTYGATALWCTFSSL
jgi:hypothetical protein